MVVTAKVAPSTGGTRVRAAAAVSESRLGSGSLYYRFTPGNLRFVQDFPSTSYVVRRDAFLETAPSIPPEQVVAALTKLGYRAVYSPEAFVTASPEPLFRPYLSRVWTYGRLRGATVRSGGRHALRPSTVAVLVVALVASLGWILSPLGLPVLTPWLVLWIAYGAAVLLTAVIGGIRFGSPAVAGLTAVAMPAVHASYALGFVEGFLRGRRCL